MPAAAAGTSVPAGHVPPPWRSRGSPDRPSREAERRTRAADPQPALGRLGLSAQPTCPLSEQAGARVGEPVVAAQSSVDHLLVVSRDKLLLDETVKGAVQ